MVSIQQSARNQFGQDVTRKRPDSAYNSSGQLEFDYSSTTDTTVNIVIIKNYQSNEQLSKEGIKEIFPAKLIGDPTLDIKEYDLIVTATETFQVLNAQVKANNITGSVLSDPSYFYCDLTYFDHDTILES